MLPEQITKHSSNQVSRSDETPQNLAQETTLSPAGKVDAKLKSDITNALWKDDVLRALDCQDINVIVKNGVVTLNGHITSSSNQHRVTNTLYAIPEIVEIQNNLVLDDQLTLDVASALRGLEHTHDCKFFTGASHGVISLNGTVSNEDIRLQAEKYAADTPNVRGVINNIYVPRSKHEASTLPFLQPIIGEMIYFLDWVSGVVKQVVINPNNRRVNAMVIQGKFASPTKTVKPSVMGATLTKEQLFVIPISTVRHLTKTSVFLFTQSKEKDQYTNFIPGQFISPPVEWAPPYPYCPEDVLFSLEKHEEAI